MLLDLVLLIGIAWGAGALAGRLGYPPVLGELAAGVLFGPPLLGVFGPVAPGTAPDVLATLGVVFLMLLAGLRADPASVGRHAPAALAPAMAGLALPLGLGVLVVVGVGGGTAGQGVLVGTILGVTALATVSRVLLDLGLLPTDLGQRLLCVSLLEVILVLITFAVVFGASDPEAGSLSGVVARAGAFLLGAGLVGGWGLPALGDWLGRRGLLDGPGAFTVGALVAVGGAGASQAAGLTIVPGAFAAGLFLTPAVLGDRFEATAASVQSVGLGLLTPVFFFTAGFSADLGALLREPVLVLGIVAAGFGGKVLAGLLGGRVAGTSWRDGLLLGVGMNGRGGIDVILAGTALAASAISPDLFTALVLTTFLTTLPMPVLLQRGLRTGAPATARSPV